MTRGPCSLLHALLASRKGSIAIQAALFIPVLAVLGAAAIELTQITADKRRLGDLADAAALAGARDIALAMAEPAAEARAKAWVEGALAEKPIDASLEILSNVVDRSTGKVMRVEIKAHRMSFFGNLLPPGGWRFSNVAEAQSVAITPLCVLATGESDSKVINTKDRSVITAPMCLVHSNRDMVVEGSSKILAGAAQAVKKASGTISPAALEGAPTIQDPFADLDVAWRKCSGASPPPRKIEETLPEPIPAGVHCSDIEIMKGAEVRFARGEHWFIGGKLIVKEDAKLVGEDVVLLFNKESKFDFKDRATVNLDGRKSGPYAGFVMIGTRDNTQDFVITSDNVDRLLGVIYVPSAKLIVEGKDKVAESSEWTVLVAERIELKGDPSLVINANYAASDVPVPEGVGPTNAEVRLVD